MGRALLIIVLGTSIIFGIDHVELERQQGILEQRNINYAEQVQAHNIASTMIDLGISDLNNNIAWRSGVVDNNILGGSGSVTVVDPSTDPSLGIYDLKLFGEGTFNGVTAKIQVLLRRTSYSKYAYFTNYEPRIYFVTGDTVKGPLHTNGTVHILGNPVFEGDVTSPHNWIGSGKPQFLGGYDFGSNAIQLPTNLTSLGNMAAAGGLSFNNDINMTFKNNGTVDISQLQFNGYMYTWSSPQTYNLSNYNGVIASTGNITVQGVVKGKVTVYSQRNINISGDITYATDPIKKPTSGDLLGLISKNDIIVDNGAQKVHGNKDLTIQAAMMALNSFSVQNYYTGQPRGQLNILGGIVQGTRGPVGTVNNQGNIATGYTKNYDYDKRLMSEWPPGYPLEDSYSIISWDE